jgi:hypothetical protein
LFLNFDFFLFAPVGRKKNQNLKTIFEREIFYFFFFNPPYPPFSFFSKFWTWVVFVFLVGFGCGSKVALHGCHFYAVARWGVESGRLCVE